MSRSTTWSAIALVLISVGYGCSKPRTAPIALVTDPNLLHLEVTPTRDLLASSESTRMAVRVRISAEQIERQTRRPINLALVVDTSSSMEGAPIDAARSASLGMIDRLRDGDVLSVVSFGSTAQVLVPTTRLDPTTRANVRKQISQMKARGTTDLAAGLVYGLNELATGRTGDTINRVVLLSDGVPNDASAIPNLIAQAQSLQAPIAAFGLGIDFDENLLGLMASQTGGVYRYIEEADSATAVAEVFDREVIRLRELVGRNVTVSLVPGPGVAIQDIPGFAMTMSGTTRAAFVGDLAAGEVRDLIVPLDVTGRREGATVEVLDVAVQFEDVVAGSGMQRREAFVAARSSSDKDALAASVKVDIEIALARATAAGAILQAIGLARGGNLDGARQVLAVAEGNAREEARKFDDAELLALAEQMAEPAPNLASLVAVAPAPMPAAEGIPVDRSAAPVSMDEADYEPSVAKRAHKAARTSLHGE